MTPHTPTVNAAGELLPEQPKSVYSASGDLTGSYAGAARHTPGPWEVDGTGYRTEGNGVCIMAWPNCVAIVGAHNHDMPNAANARLIAAAPKLLQALRSARLLLERCGPQLQGAQPECCGQYEAGYGGEYMGQREIVPVCCGNPIDLSDHIANELGVIDAAIALATGGAAALATQGVQL